jgi:DNA uptake protein ComE-like DNA-binding protein
MKRETSKLRAMVIILLAALALAACGGAATSTTTSPASSQPAGQATAENANAPTTTSAGATGATSPSQDASSAPTTTASTGGTAAASTKLNLNDVTADQLLNTIPDLGDRMVREFFEYRPYVSIQQFRREIGKYVSAEQVAAYEQYVYVPIDVDAADAATLQQLPGVDANTAAALIAGRPYDSNQTFLTKLAGYVSDANVKQAQSYLAAK